MVKWKWYVQGYCWQCILVKRSLISCMRKTKFNMVMLIQLSEDHNSYGLSWLDIPFLIAWMSHQKGIIIMLRCMTRVRQFYLLVWAKNTITFHHVYQNYTLFRPKTQQYPWQNCLLLSNRLESRLCCVGLKHPLAVILCDMSHNSCETLYFLCPVIQIITAFCRFKTYTDKGENKKSFFIFLFVDFNRKLFFYSFREFRDRIVKTIINSKNNSYKNVRNFLVFFRKESNIK